MTATTLYCIHGAGCDASAFAAQTAAFANAVAVTLPGHDGRGGGPATISEFADGVAEDVRARGIGAVVLCGHSMGAAIALDLALRGLLPELRGIVALGGGAKMRVAPAVFERLESDFPAGARAFCSLFFDRDPGGRVDAAVATMLAVGKARTIGDLRAVNAFDVIERLPELPVPLLAVTGEHDRLTPPDRTQLLADRVRDGEARILPGAGHFAMLEEPEATNAAIQAFLDRVSRP